MKKPLSNKMSPLDDFSSYDSRENYLFFADNDYLGARALCLIKIYLPAGFLAQQAVEKYMKLKLIDLTNIKVRKKIFSKCNHNLLCLFRPLSQGMQANNLKLSSEQFYRDLLERLTNCFKWKYFDKQGLRGALSQTGSITTGMGESLLPKFDQLCMELRNAVFLEGLGASPVNQAINGIKPWSRGDHINFSWAFYTKNKFARKFSTH